MMRERLHEYRAFGPTVLRWIVGFHLVHGTVDNVVSWSRMHEFAEFLAANGFPLPLTGAVVSAWSQFLCGLLLLLGLWVRPAAAVMIVNFIAAVAIAHVGDPYPVMFPALFMLFGALSLLLSGPGAWALGPWLGRRGPRRLDGPPDSR